MDPLDYMVEDCWLHLFNFLSAKDKQALGQTCETFFAMLQPHKTKWAFGLILPHISKYLLPKLPYGYSRYLNLNQQLTFNLTLRLVCKSWKASFDKLCALHRNDHCRTNHSIIQQHYNLRNVSSMETFLNFFKDHQGNPFIGRVVKIYATSTENLEEDEEPEVNDEGSAAAEEIEEGDDEDEVEDWRRAAYEIYLRDKLERSLKYKELQMELLSKYGEEIEYLTLNGIGRNNNDDLNYCIQLDGCKHLQLVLCNTPKLQSLELSLHPFTNEPEEPEVSTFQTDLVEYFEANPLPKMPTLRELTLKQNNPTMDTLLLEAYGGHVQTLLINNSLEIPLSVWDNMKCLKNLNLRGSDFANNEKILQAIQSPLEILSIYELSRYMMNPRQFLIDKFLLAVQHLPLKKVMVCPASSIVKESVPFPADFPKHFTITKLTFRGIRSTSLNFLRFLPNLEKLVVGDKEFPYPTNVFRQMN